MERKVVIFDHPLIQHKLSILRDETTSTKDFRQLVNEIAMLMMFEATRDLPTEEIDVKEELSNPKDTLRNSKMSAYRRPQTCFRSYSSCRTRYGRRLS